MASSSSPPIDSNNKGVSFAIRKALSGDQSLANSAMTSSLSSSGASSSGSGSLGRKASITAMLFSSIGMGNDESEITKHIIQKAKSNKQEVIETIQSLEIGRPYSVEHKIKGTFDANNIRYSGIPQEWSEFAHKQFGIPLAHCPRVEADNYVDRIPLVLVKLRNRLEELDGLKAEGIFRLAPNGTESTGVKAGMNSGSALESLQTTNDPHVPSNLIKQFFRELPPNLLNPLSRDDIIEITAMGENKDAITKAFKKLPEPNHSTYMWLLDLLLDVSAFESVNKMSQKNLAIVISPNLYFAGNDAAPMEALVLSQKVAQLVTISLKWRTLTRYSKKT